MKLMIIDDEALALAHLENMLHAASEHFSLPIEVSPFQLAEDALREAPAIKPDVVFLDIHMPGKSGLQTAIDMQEGLPQTDIVFVTAYDEYAVQAFDINAMDYILKPYTLERVVKTLERIVSRRVMASKKPAEAQGEMPFKQRIHSFRTIRFEKAGLEPELPKWRTSKAQELFSYLLHRRGEVVLKSTIMELLTPELEPKKATTQLYTVVYQIRQCLRQFGLDVTINNSSIQEGYVLNTGATIVASEEWEQRLEQLQMRSSETAAEAERLLEQYDGDYLEDHDYVWAENERERLRQVWLTHARRLAAYYMRESDWNAALTLYERIQSFEPYNEEEGLITLQLLERCNQHDKVGLHYRKLQEVFVDDLGISMPSVLEKWYANWRLNL
ncbi:response regulator [Paenibacillus soyae]|uniref:Response regulator n=1 Tax=Paenibacillus soyae TaxID=2969249 RepID=A0A9X2SAH4_9BACL|nr:response regulator [Paenibacillus soyae]MCR2806689.1 response regulator [Paenibacillus soyae]